MKYFVRKPLTITGLSYLLYILKNKGELNFKLCTLCFSLSFSKFEGLSKMTNT